MGQASGASGAAVPAPAPARDADSAWSAFLAEHAPLLLQVVHLFERDADEVQDCFLFVCEHLHRDGQRRIQRFRTGGPASFATWLRAVVRRLCIDWRRHRDGRFRLPRAPSPGCQTSSRRCSGPSASVASPRTRLSTP